MILANSKPAQQKLRELIRANINGVRGNSPIATPPGVWLTPQGRRLGVKL